MNFDISCASQSNESNVSYVTHNKVDLSRLQSDWLIFSGWKNKSKHKTAGFSAFISFQYIQYSVHKEGVLCLRNIQRSVIKGFDGESMRNVGTQLSDNATLSTPPCVSSVV